MKKILSYLAIGFAAVSLTGCYEEDEFVLNRPSGLAMRYNVLHTNSTRGVPTTSENFESNMENFQVWAYYTADATGEGVTPGGRHIGTSDTEGTIIDGDGAGGWDYHDPSKEDYWPEVTAPLNFQAISPASDASFTIENTPANGMAHLTAVVTVPTDVTAQKNIMFAKANNQTSETNAQSVSLAFEQALSQVTFQGRTSSMYIKADITSIEICNVHAEGKVGYFASDASLGATVTDEASTTYSVGIAEDSVLSGTTVKNLTAEDGALLMLPQTVPAWETSSGTSAPTNEADAKHQSYLKVRCTITNTLDSITLLNDGCVYIPFSINWEQGKKHTYTIVIGEGTGGYNEEGEENDVDFSIEQPNDSTWIKATYTSATSGTYTLYKSNSFSPSRMYVNGEEIVPSSTYEIPAGETTVYYYIKDITSIPTSAFNGCSGLTSVSLPSTLTWIGHSAFQYCSGLTSIVIPEGVTTIGNYAFSRCSGLTSVDLPSTLTTINNYAFQYCSGLTSIDLPDGVKIIGSSAFNGCSGLSRANFASLESLLGVSFANATSNPLYYAKNLYIAGEKVTDLVVPEGITSIGNYTFYNCSGLTSVSLPSTLTSVGGYAFNGCSGLTSIVIPEGVTTINNNTFYNCSGLTSVSLPSTLTTIGSYAFSYCRGLTSVSLPSTLTTIGYYAFQYCTGLSSIDIPEGVTTIGNYTFSGCSGLTSIVIPEGVTTIGSSAFDGCSGLTSIVIPEGVTTIGSSAFNGCSGLTRANFASLESLLGITFGNSTSNPLSYAKNLYIAGEEVKDLVIPEGITSIGNYTFYNCSGLTSVSLPSTLTSVGGYAFNGCSGLTSIVIPEGVTTINSGTFSGCSGLTSVSLPSTLTSINNYAFRNCSGLSSIDIPEGVTSIGSSAFSGCGGLTSVSLPSTLTSINNYAFQYCSGLTSITIPEGVTSIGSSAFSGCGCLTSITIPEGVTTINQHTFDNCGGLTSVSLPSTLTSIAGQAFYKCTSLSNIFSKASTAPTVVLRSFELVKTGGTLTVPTGATGYNTWMGTGNYYLGKYGWTIVYSDDL